MLVPGDTRAISEQIDRLLRRGLHGLHFPRDLEARFDRDSAASRSHRLWREGLFSLFAFNLFYLGEWLRAHQVTHLELILQLGIITPLCLVVNLLMRFNPPYWLREGSVSFMACLIACTYLYLQLGKGPVSVAFTLVGVILTAMFTAVVMRLRFYFSLVASVLIAVAGIIFLALDHSLETDEKITGLALMVIAITVALISNYSLEREERVGYLRFLQSDLQRQEISAMNLRLAELSTRDELTALPNRRAYEDHFECLWEQAAAEASALALIVIDVDHFKVMNDVRGHAYGDEVLRRVGALIPQALRSTADFAARFGGEEFVVLLPRTDRVGALRVAERIRALIEMAGPPPQAPVPRSECLMWATASCGVSTCIPGPTLRKEVLLQSADDAMYLAKSEGRNRVCCASLDSPPAVQERVSGADDLAGEMTADLTGYIA